MAFVTSGSDFLDNTIISTTEGNNSINLLPFYQPTDPTEFARAPVINNAGFQSAFPDYRNDWTFTAINGSDFATAVAQGIGSVDALPLVRNPVLKGNGELTWDIPSTSETITNVRLQIIRDSDDASVWYSDVLPGGTTSFNIKTDVPSGVLEDGVAYAVRIRLEDRSSGGGLDGSLRNRSSTFINFIPLPPGSPDVALPSVDSNGVFNFDVDVTEGAPVILDPLVAVGYDFEVGAGDPLFTSIKILTDVGDSKYDLLLFDSGINDYLDTGIDLMANIGFNFLSDLSAFGFTNSALGRFSIRGIEESAFLDPTDVTAFMAEVTFNSTGAFTGTMTPLVTQVPEPTILALMSLGLAGVGYRRYRHR